MLEFVGHLRRVHPELPVYKAMTVTWYVDGVAENWMSRQAEAADLLAPVGTLCYYYHSRIPPYYNDLSFVWWNGCFSETFKHMLPCLTVTSTRDLKKPLHLKYCSTLKCIGL